MPTVKEQVEQSELRARKRRARITAIKEGVLSLVVSQDTPLSEAEIELQVRDNFEHPDLEDGFAHREFRAALDDLGRQGLIRAGVKKVTAWEYVPQPGPRWPERSQS